MGMSPENYRQLEQRSNALIKEAKLFLDHKSVAGHVLPMTCVEDAIALCNKISEAYIKCVTGAKNAKTPETCNRYSLLAEELSFCRKRVMERYSIIG